MNLYSLFVYIEHNGDESPKGLKVSLYTKETDVAFSYLCETFLMVCGRCSLKGYKEHLSLWLCWYDGSKSIRSEGVDLLSLFAHPGAQSWYQNRAAQYVCWWHFATGNGQKLLASLNHVRPSGNCRYHQNKQLLFCYTTLTVCYSPDGVFTARCELGL